MKYVALLSGGKDSCYNLLHCHKNGHELVAAASLGPEPGRGPTLLSLHLDEIDSYMYQTVGQDAIEYVAKALDVPLYRRVISGSAVDMSSEYGSRTVRENGALEGDETEDLYTLLSDVKSAHPDIQGVSVGAILSNYQRVRVEHVCRRLSLTPLCYLWQRDQGELLAEMVEAGLVAIIIKVAGVGLTTKHLGKTLGEMLPTLQKLNSLYGSHICGEGGEYESLTLDCPLFQKRIILEDTETVIHSDNDFATVAYLRIKNAVLEDKDAAPINPAVPSQLEERFEELHEEMGDSLQSKQSEVKPPSYDPEAAVLFFASTSRRVDHWVVVSSIHRNLSRGMHAIPIEDEVTECFQTLKEHLTKHGLNFSHCANINIFLSSMDLFTRVNAVYSSFFGSSPPARACVAATLPSPFRVRLECIAYAERRPSERQALHVQSLSYWAPANIGPYSQAVTVRDQRIFVSGQIGLIPSTLTLPSPRSLAKETALACQHVERVVKALQSNSGGGWEGHVQLTLYWMVNFGDVRHVKKAVDADGPRLFLGVPTLPKDALIEKQVVVHTGRFVGTEDDGNEVQSLKPSLSTGKLCVVEGKAASLIYFRSSFASAVAACTVVCVKGPVGDEMEGELEKVLPELIEQALTIRMFYRPHESLEDVPSMLLKHSNVPITPIPCTFVATMDQDDWDYALCILGA
ncbi:hypothetical protein PHLGIDRAFT_106172 [Phlebiopsis gigantea 11061_1 CR5-6]|uniref:Diphthine--ammonia ligase n=1 Tax=Phlebiopsis gigantea (strain 11061_1 CR5-6) TaxID=745531 RepID=A0A0C3PKU6_PHLG1|nr:hypothetical protein PHLGIDRAFT_106172 [Phlebiopsis gigantea 11061_1 CR5-6]